MTNYYSKLPSPLTRLLVILTLSFITAFRMDAQQCPIAGGTYLLRTQGEVNAFAANYPNCQYLNATLFITGLWNNPSLDITDLSPLSGLVYVQGLYVSGLGYLTNLDGLSNLTHAGFIQISNNLALNNIEGLSGITTNNISIQVFQNPALTNLSGLENIPFNSLNVSYNSSLQALTNFPATEAGSVYFQDNDMLTDLSGLENLTTLNSLQILDNDALTDISALSGTSVNGGFIYIHNNPLLTSLAPLSGTTNLYSLQITSNNSLQNLNGLQNLTSVSEGLQIGNSPQLSDISALSNLTYCPYISILLCPSLTNLNGLGGLTSIVDIWIDNLPLLTSLDGLSNLNDVQYFALTYTGVNSLSGLSSLTSIGELVYLYGNPQLSNCSIEALCTLLGFEGFSEIYDNASGCNSPQEVKDNCNDTTPPTIVCTNNSTTVDADAGQCAYTVPGTAFDPLSWEDNLPGATLSNNYNNSSSLAGAVFPTGTTAVVWTVTDQSGNTATCTIQVVVIGQPCGWSTPPNGVGCTNGSASAYNPSTGVWTLTSTNCFSQGGFNSDNLAFIQNELCGNGSITVQVTGINGTGYAGITLRESDNPGAKKVELTTSLSNLNRRAIRTLTGGMAVPQPFPSQGRFWLRITRTGNQFVGYVSSNGTNWAMVINANVNMSSCILAGMVLSNGQPNSTVSATFANVQITANNALAMPSDGIQTEATADPENLAFSFFPNPASEIVTLDLNQLAGQDVTFTVYNSLGQVVEVRDLGLVEETTKPFSLSPFESGIYYLQAITAQGRSVPQRLVVQPR